MSNVTASLRVVLYADTVMVAESTDALLWQRVLGVINGGQLALDPPKGLASAFTGDEAAVGERRDEEEVAPRGQKSSVGKFAADIGASVEEVQAACDPQAAEPFLILDHDAWEAFKTQLGDRGLYAVAPVAAAATLLALWFKNSNGHATATQAQAQVVLKSIHVRDANASRGVRRSEWLQSRAGGQIILNPAKITKAKMFARCFCTQDWTEWKASK